MNFLLDTNVVSEWARPRPEPRIVAWLAELQHGTLSLPVGAKRDRLLAWLDEDLLERFESRIIGVTPAVARDWGAVCVLAQRAGKPIGAMDAFFAATARVQGLTLVTRNDADFSAVGVELLNPWRG